MTTGARRYPHSRQIGRELQGGRRDIGSYHKAGTGVAECEFGPIRSGKWRAGGPSKIVDEILVNGALDLLEAHALGQRPDGVAESEVQETFAQARVAVTNQRVDLDTLYRVLRDYEERFKGTKTKPSTGEMQKFLTDLEQTVLPLGSVR